MSYKVAQNQWSCALACVVSLANDNQIQITQEEASKLYFRFFPEWREMEGVLSRMGIVRLMEAMDLSPNFVLMTDNFSEFLEMFAKKEKQFVGAFTLLQNPYHCLRIIRTSGDEVEVFDSGQIKSKPDIRKWTDLLVYKPDFLLFGN